MVWEYFATDYKKIDDIQFKGKTLKELGDNNIKTKALKKALEKCQEAIDNNSQATTVCVREKGWNYRNSDKYKLTFKAGEIELLKGIAGRVNVYLKAKELEGLKEDVKIILTIYSRFDEDYDRPYFLLRMLAAQVLIPNDSALPSKDDDLFDFLLLYQFKQAFIEAYSNGVFKKYRRVEKNDHALKGTIDFGRHIRENVIANNFSITYSFRENTVDNEINHLILHTYYYIRRNKVDLFRKIFEQDYNFASSIKNIEYRLTGFDMSNLKKIINDTSKPISHPLFQSYESLRVICRKILRNEYYSFFGDDTSNEVSGVLYYLPDLWEQELEQQFKNHGFAIKSQNEYKWLFEGNKHFLAAYPDLIIEYNDACKYEIVADAKFKPVWSSDFWHKNNEDNKRNDYDKQTISNDLNKLIRDMMVTGKKYGAIIAPSNNEKTGNYSYRVAENSENKLFRIIINIPKEDKSFADWVTEYEKNVKTAIKNLKEVLKDGNNAAK